VRRPKSRWTSDFAQAVLAGLTTPMEAVMKVGVPHNTVIEEERSIRSHLPKTLEGSVCLLIITENHY
jgi:hypothetical protein